jgi:hypothetical protein
LLSEPEVNIAGSYSFVALIQLGCYPNLLYRGAGL